MKQEDSHYKIRMSNTLLVTKELSNQECIKIGYYESTKGIVMIIYNASTKSTTLKNVRKGICNVRIIRDKEQTRRSLSLAAAAFLKDIINTQDGI